MEIGELNFELINNCQYMQSIRHITQPRSTNMQPLVGVENLMPVLCLKILELAHARFPLFIRSV